MGKTPTPKAYILGLCLRREETLYNPPEVILEAAKLEEIPAIRKVGRRLVESKVTAMTLEIITTIGGWTSGQRVLAFPDHGTHGYFWWWVVLGDERIVDIRE